MDDENLLKAQSDYTSIKEILLLIEEEPSLNYFVSAKQLPRSDYLHPTIIGTGFSLHSSPSVPLNDKDGLYHHYKILSHILESVIEKGRFNTNDISELVSDLPSYLRKFKD